MYSVGFVPEAEEEEWPFELVEEDWAIENVGADDASRTVRGMMGDV